MDIRALTWTQISGFADLDPAASASAPKDILEPGLAEIVNQDFWEYEVAANTWTQKANFGGGYRNNATGFSIGNKGYIGNGYNKGAAEGI